MYRKFCVGLFTILLFIQSYSQSNLLDYSFHPDSIRAIVQMLASDSFKGRLSGSAGCLDAAHFIANQFNKAGLKPMAGGIGYFWPVGTLGFNVIGAIQGKTKSEEIVIFSAHYDHIGTSKTNPTGYHYEQISSRKNDSIYNGANDDASGVSAVISLANYFSKQNNNERTILFIAFTGEELGLLGSKSFAENLKPEFVKAVVNIEMIGRTRGKSDNPFFTGAEQSNLFDIMNKRLRKFDPVNYKKPYFIKDYFGSEKLYERSDNYSFVGHGITAHSIMLTSPTDKYYHSLSDEYFTLDYEVMSKIINAIAIASAGLVNGEDTPSISY
jgi:Zn-dependent M28 family amino/carboxypeptidase